jgi:hypothetical protein
LRLGTFVILVAAVACATITPVASGSRDDQDLAPSLAAATQYQEQGRPVSDHLSPAVSRRITDQIYGSSKPYRSRDFRLDRRSERSADRVVEIAAEQYQGDPDESKRRVMAVIGVGFAAAYVVFVAAWIWATRYRSRPRRH